MENSKLAKHEATDIPAADKELRLDCRRKRAAPQTNRERLRIRKLGFASSHDAAFRTLLRRTRRENVSRESLANCIFRNEDKVSNELCGTWHSWAIWSFVEPLIYLYIVRGTAINFARFAAAVCVLLFFYNEDFLKRHWRDSDNITRYDLQLRN